MTTSSENDLTRIHAIVQTCGVAALKYNGRNAARRDCATTCLQCEFDMRLVEWTRLVRGMGGEQRFVQLSGASLPAAHQALNQAAEHAGSGLHARHRRRRRTVQLQAQRVADRGVQALADGAPRAGQRCRRGAGGSRQASAGLRWTADEHIASTGTAADATGRKHTKRSDSAHNGVHATGLLVENEVGAGAAAHPPAHPAAPG